MQFLLVWEDTRSGEADIYAARVLPDGTSLDGAGVPISTRPGAQKLPAVTFDGTQFIVAWQDERSGNKDIFAARVKPDGTVVDPEGLPVATSPREELSPALTSDGSGGVLASWHEVVDFNGEIRGAWMVQGQFTPLADFLSGSVTAAYTGLARNLSLAYGAGSYLVVWTAPGRRSSQSEVWGAVLPSGGASGPMAPFAIGTDSSATLPEVAFSGTSFLVTWIATDRFEARARRVSPGGALEGQEWVLNSVKPYTRPALTFDGSAFIVAWEIGSGGRLGTAAASPLGTPSGFEQVAAEPFYGYGAGRAGGITLASGPQGKSLLAYARFDELEHTVRVRARLLTSSSVPPDAGMGGGTDGGTEEPEPADSGCRCSSSSGSLVFGAVLLVWLSALSTRARRRFDERG